MDIEVRRIPLKDYLADPAAMDAAADANTLMIVGSAPCFPFGLIDPTPELSAIAEKRGLWLHVDACVGGYFAPFAAMNGAELTPWDFALPGVMSISAVDSASQLASFSSFGPLVSVTAPGVLEVNGGNKFRFMLSGWSGIGWSSNFRLKLV